MDLFDHAMKDRIAREAPLAARMRPRTLDEFEGQEEIVGEDCLLRRAIQADRLFSEKTAFFGVLSRQIAFSLPYSSGDLPEPEKPRLR